MPQRDDDAFEKPLRFVQDEPASGQLHIRLLRHDTVLLRQLAKDRDQTLGATVRFLLYRYLAERNVR